jgi:hypothetical protein
MENSMATDTIDAFRATGYAIAEAIAPTWERRRADIEEVPGMDAEGAGTA